ncbi:MAG: hypothetical protein MHM6MM_003745 [Cercozoa sp. M6MM]
MLVVLCLDSELCAYIQRQHNASLGAFLRSLVRECRSGGPSAVHVKVLAPAETIREHCHEVAECSLEFVQLTHRSHRTCQLSLLLAGSDTACYRHVAFVNYSHGMLHALVPAFADLRAKGVETLTVVVSDKNKLRLSLRTSMGITDTTLYFSRILELQQLKQQQQRQQQQSVPASKQDMEWGVRINAASGTSPFAVEDAMRKFGDIKDFLAAPSKGKAMGKSMRVVFATRTQAIAAKRACHGLSVLEGFPMQRPLKLSLESKSNSQMLSSVPPAFRPAGSFRSITSPWETSPAASPVPEESSTDSLPESPWDVMSVSSTASLGHPGDVFKDRDSTIGSSSTLSSQVSEHPPEVSSLLSAAQRQKLRAASPQLLLRAIKILLHPKPFLFVQTSKNPTDNEALQLLQSIDVIQRRGCRRNAFVWAKLFLSPFEAESVKLAFVSVNKTRYMLQMLCNAMSYLHFVRTGVVETAVERIYVPTERLLKVLTSASHARDLKNDAASHFHMFVKTVTTRKIDARDILEYASLLQLVDQRHDGIDEVCFNEHASDLFKYFNIHWSKPSQSQWCAIFDRLLMSGQAVANSE